MRENEEALAMQQKESLRSFAEDIYNKVGSRIPSAVLTHDGLCYTIEFNTADRFSLVLMGSETNNADCFQSMLVFGIEFSEIDRRSVIFIRLIYDSDAAGGFLFLIGIERSDIAASDLAHES